jgi:hypothetical protein
MSRACLGCHAAACRSPAGKAAPPGRRAPKGGSHSQPAGLRLPALGPPVRGFRQVPVASPSCRAPVATVCSRRPPFAHAQLRTHGRRRVSPSRWSHLCNNSLITLPKNRIILHTTTWYGPPYKPHDKQPTHPNRIPESTNQGPKSYDAKSWSRKQNSKWLCA